MCLLKTGACLIQVHFYVFACFGNRIHACLIQVACLIEVATKTMFTVLYQEHNSDQKLHFFNFFHSKALGTKFDLAIK